VGIRERNAAAWDAQDARRNAKPLTFERARLIFSSTVSELYPTLRLTWTAREFANLKSFIREHGPVFKDALRLAFSKPTQYMQYGGRLEISFRAFYANRREILQQLAFAQQEKKIEKGLKADDPDEVLRKLREKHGKTKEGRLQTHSQFTASQTGSRADTNSEPRRGSSGRVS